MKERELLYTLTTYDDVSPVQLPPQFDTSKRRGHVHIGQALLGYS